MVHTFCDLEEFIKVDMGKAEKQRQRENVWKRRDSVSQCRGVFLRPEEKVSQGR